MHLNIKYLFLVFCIFIPLSTLQSRTALTFFTHILHMLNQYSRWIFNISSLLKNMLLIKFIMKYLLHTNTLYQNCLTNRDHSPKSFIPNLCNILEDSSPIICIIIIIITKISFSRFSRTRIEKIKKKSMK